MHARSDLRHLYSPKFFGNSPRKTLAISSAATLVILFSARMLDPAICGVITHFPIKEGVIGAWWFFLEDVLDTYQYWYNRLRVHQPLGRSLSMEALSKQYDVGVAQLLNTEKDRHKQVTYSVVPSGKKPISSTSSYFVRSSMAACVFSSSFNAPKTPVSFSRLQRSPNFSVVHRVRPQQCPLQQFLQ